MSPDTPVYVPGYGEMTARDVADMVAEHEPKVCGEWEATLQMWDHIALNPHARPWASTGATSKDAGASPASVSTSGRNTGRSTSSGTSTDSGSNAASAA